MRQSADIEKHLDASFYRFALRAREGVGTTGFKSFNGDAFPLTTGQIGGVPAATIQCAVTVTDNVFQFGGIEERWIAPPMREQNERKLIVAGNDRGVLHRVRCRQLAVVFRGPEQICSVPRHSVIANTNGPALVKRTGPSG